MKTFASNPEKCLEGDAAILDRLNYGWNNEDWSGSREHLRACLRLALRTSGPILECGSGLSTILLGIVCDGPPGETKGGRYGMMPVMRSRLKPGAWVLLDDAEREDERAIAARWAEECRASYETRGENRRFVEMTMPSASRHTGPDIETSP